jgi:hypothetical protein
VLSYCCFILFMTFPGEVEACLKASGSSFEWMDNGVLKTITKALPAVRLDEGPRRSNSKNFFNSLVAAYTGERECLIVCFCLVIMMLA